MTTAVKQTTAKSPSPAPAKRDPKLVDMSSHRESMIQQRQRDAIEAKARTLKMYDNMAKSGSAGDHRPLDIDTYRGKESGKPILSGAAIQKVDYVEETIRERVRASEENKKRLLAAYDYAAKTQPAGTVRDVDFETFKGVDGKFNSLPEHIPTCCNHTNRSLMDDQSQCLHSSRTNRLVRQHVLYQMECHIWPKVSWSSLVSSE